MEVSSKLEDRSQDTDWIEDWVCPRAGLEDSEEWRKVSYICSPPCCQLLHRQASGELNSGLTRVCGSPVILKSLLC
jgi:hypothetical protein